MSITKTKALTLNGAHTAGIFADMSIDGPVIGTLVAVVDRAKNLPNRKTIGKQDPYCAARLGKEAKKTTTDIRGGQTPKWDQELRFTVHDSPDYYQLKVSVFTDDKKTDLIGETWIDLKGIIVPGGGQSDMWQGLTCRGKYAGEIRVEITFYDSRPRPERPVVRKMQHAATETDAAVLAMRQRAPIRRRPLPSDPVNGGEMPAVAAPPVSLPLPSELPHSLRSHHHKSASYSGFVPSQSPLQSIEYHPPPQGARQPAEFYAALPAHSALRREHHRLRESHSTPLRYQDNPGFGWRGHPSPVELSDSLTPPGSFSQIHELPVDLEAPAALELRAGASPPPPPAHRSRQSSADPEPLVRGSRDASPQKSPRPFRQDVLRSEAHRHTVSAYPGQPVFKPYEPPSLAQASSPSSRSELHYDPPPASRRHSQSPGWNPPKLSPRHRSMQPTVEDVPDSPTVALKHGNSQHTAAARQDDTSYHSGPNPASQDQSKPAGAYGQASSQSPPYKTRAYPDLDSQTSSSVSPLSSLDYSLSSSKVSYNSQHSQPQHIAMHSDLVPSHSRASSAYSFAALPPTPPLGADLGTSRDVARRSFENHTYQDQYGGQQRQQHQQYATPDRGRHRRDEGLPPYANSSPYNHTPQSHDGRSVITYSSRPDPQAAKPRDPPSPRVSPQHQIQRKSVSPAPLPSENRTLSDVPFGPDSYDAFNPSLGSTGAKNAQDAKIITHDGREIDPSDHLPMDTWAPEPEPRTRQPSPEPRARLSPSGAQPMPPTGRRPLRVTGRPDATPAQQPELVRTPPKSGRNRLQRKLGLGGHRSHASVSSPLAPAASPDDRPEKQPTQTLVRGHHRGKSLDYPMENYFTPLYGTAPPVPAKVPLAIMSGANGTMDASLMEEMQRIDIGAGRSRRRGGF